MTDMAGHLAKAPIVEAVLDINCDLPPDHSLEDKGRFARLFEAEYPVIRERRLHEQQIALKTGQLENMSISQRLEAIQFLTEDEKQLVQARASGYSFNRLAPYESLDAYLPEIERTWDLYRGEAKPVTISTIKLRYINRFNLPMHDGSVTLEDYLTIHPRLPDEESLGFASFMNQYQVVEKETQHVAKIVLLSRQPTDEGLPLIFDIEAIAARNLEPDAWSDIVACIDALRKLKNHIFHRSLTEQCLSLFQ